MTTRKSLSISHSEAWLAKENDAILRDRGLRHPFLMNLSGSLLSKDVARPLIHEIFYMVQNFPFHIAASIGSCRDEDFFLIMADNLFVETGQGSGAHHIEIFRDLLRALDLKEDRLLESEVWATTRRLEQVCAKNYSSWDMGSKLGSLYAFETMSGPMVTYWDLAFSRNGFLKPSAYRFFTIHKEIEIRHSNELEPIILKYAGDPDFRDTFETARMKVMSALSDWWDDMQSTVGSGQSAGAEEELLATT